MTHCTESAESDVDRFCVGRTTETVCAANLLLPALPLVSSNIINVPSRQLLIRHRYVLVIFYPRNTLYSVVLAVTCVDYVLCPLSVTSQCSIEMVGGVEPVLTPQLLLTYPTL